MKPINANEAKYERVEMFKQNGIFTDVRIKRETVPEGLYVYDCRHSDNGDWCTPVTVEENIVYVNFCGTLITKEPIKFRNYQTNNEGEKFGWRNIYRKNYRWLDGPPVNLKEFIETKEEKTDE